MLVLTRKIGEKIKIGEDIEVSVLEVTRSGVKIGISAPRQVPVFRLEVFERVQEENIRAAAGSLDNLETALELWRGKDSK
jgi:carbon storage regulator